MNTIDLIIFIAYCLLILSVGLFVSRGKKGDERDAGDYFLAGRGLAWWAIGASIIASNISAEQFVGMSGSGYAIGLAMATYEWIAALGLILVAKFFIPIFLEKKIFTMPQFLEERFDKRVKTVMAVFWLAVFIFINLTSILYLGALTIEKVMGIPMLYGIIGLAAFAGIYSIYGGLKVVALTDVVQVVFLVGGGLVTTYIALDLLGEGDGVYQGMVNLYGEASDKFHLILDKSHPGYKDLPGISVILGGLWVANLYGEASDKFHLILDKSHPGYKDLPGISVILGGLWVANLYYWGCNQYIIQRALAAKSVREAQNGMLFAGFIKLFIPLLVVIPGIAAFALDAPLGKSDEAYPWLLGNLLPVGVKGVAFAALTAAIVSSLASMMNSISTIFTMDIYRSYFRKEAGQKELVHTGRWASFGSLLVAVLIAPMLSGLDQAFQYIQEFTGFVSPGALSIFLAGFFYKRATANGALVAALGSFVFSFGMKFLFPGLPWMDRMGLVFLMCCALIVLLGKKGQPANAYTRHDPALFHTGRMFNVMSVVILAILIGFYYFWW